jgi:hypothetical protein
MNRLIKAPLLPAVFLLTVPALGQQPAAPPSPLPVRQVTLFTSGVSYTERAGDVDGNATIPLLFRTAQINDILKSMVLLDQTGKVQPATYAARDPIGHTLQSFAVDVTQNLTIEDVLTRLRGARVTVDTANKGTITGQIVGVEKRQVAGEDGKPITVPFLNLLGESGLTSVRLDAEKTVKLLDERLNREFREALGLLSTSADDQRRQVTLHFAGNGKRLVRVGYVTEAPLWKMTYRLVMGRSQPGQAAGKPYLQGWALVENTTDDDWQNISLSLVSGRPVSFIQDLYQPLYIPRPVVGPDVVASPYPQTHAGNLEEQRKAAVANTPPVYGGAFLGVRSDRASGGVAGGRGANGPPAGAPPATAIDSAVTSNNKGNYVDIDGRLRDSVAAQAAGQSAGETFQYNISTPVTLPRQQAAMIPVVAQDIDGEKLSLYNADSDARFPMNAFRIRNNTGLHLKGGPITLFDDGVYAGDAKMEDIPPADSRLVTYAVDLSVEGERQGPSASMIETALTLKRGVLTITRREKQETIYTLKSKADKTKTILIEHPFNAELKLIAPAKATERTASLYRFAVTVPPGKSETLKVVTERPILQTIAILDADMDSLSYYANRKDISAKLRETLQDVVQRRRKVAELQAQAAAREAEITAISADQDRIRKNMAALDKASALYKRYVTQLDNQETQIQSIRSDAVRLRKEAAVADRDLRAFVDNLVITE